MMAGLLIRPRPMLPVGRQSAQLGILTRYACAATERPAWDAAGRCFAVPRNQITIASPSRLRPWSLAPALVCC